MIYRFAPLLLLVTIAAAPQPTPLAVALAPGPAHDAVKRMLLKPYAQATNTELAEPGWDGQVGSLKAANADLALVDGAQLAGLCAGKLAEAVDWPSLGSARFVAQAVTPCGVGAYITATVLAWDKDKMEGWPGWPDFWDVTKHPGRRGLHRGARGNLEIALLADGVSLRDVYRVLGTRDGVERAFRKLDQLKPYIIWWDQAAQPGQWLGAGKVLMTSSAPGLLPPSGLAGGRHIGVQWAGGLSELNFWAVLKGAPHAGAARLALQVASDGARQAEFAKATGLGPTSVAGLAMLPQSTRAQSPAAPENLQSALALDDVFWAENGPRLEARFQAWAAH